MSAFNPVTTPTWESSSFFISTSEKQKFASFYPWLRHKCFHPWQPFFNFTIDRSKLNAQITKPRPCIMRNHWIPLSVKLICLTWYHFVRFDDRSNVFSWSTTCHFLCNQKVESLPSCHAKLLKYFLKHLLLLWTEHCSSQNPHLNNCHGSLNFALDPKTSSIAALWITKR